MKKANPIVYRYGSDMRVWAIHAKLVQFLTILDLGMGRTYHWKKELVILDQIKMQIAG